jgi:adenosylcobyric acid synthase
VPEVELGEHEDEDGFPTSARDEAQLRDDDGEDMSAPSVLGRGVMVCGTASDAGKSRLVGGICRMLARRGVKVAPFKAQNMALNSYVTRDGAEIGRAQAVQAFAAGIEPEVSMNPILLKPTGEQACQVVLNGEPIGHLTASQYHELKPSLLEVVLEALAGLRRRFDVVVLEGAGSPAEINLMEHDIVNLRVAYECGLPAIIVGDIDRGGVFASLFGTVELLPPHYRRLVKGFVINKLRGDPELLLPGTAHLEQRCGIRTLGVLPFLDDLVLDAEDSLALEDPRPRARAGWGREGTREGDCIDVAALRLPRMSNFTDLDALEIEPSVAVRFVQEPAQLGDPDLVIVPGTKATVSDLDWLRGRALDRAVEASTRRGTTVLGICGGYQMLGGRIVDHVESGRGEVAGLGWLDVETRFSDHKLTRQRRGVALENCVSGYEIRHGRVDRGRRADPWVRLEDGYGSEEEGATAIGTQCFFGTSLHGLFDEDAFRAAFLAQVATRRRKAFVASGVSFSSERERQLDRFADLVECHLDVDALERIIASGTAPVSL